MSFQRFRIAAVSVFVCLFSFGAHSQTAHPNFDAVPGPYLTTRDQAGHEFVKTEQFVVPVGASVVVKGLEFSSGQAALTPAQKAIVQQVFNALEEITENTVEDPDKDRVAALAKMEFEIRGYADSAEKKGAAQALAEERARAVMDHLAYLGTPPWRLHAKGVVAEKSAGRRVIFVRIK